MELKVRSSAFVRVFIILALCAVAIMINRASFYTILAVLFWAAGITYSLRNIKNRFALLSFLIGYFVFILGGFSINYIKTGGFAYFPNSNQTITHTTLSVCVSLAIVISISIILHERKSFYDSEQIGDNNTELEIIPSSYKLLLTVLLIGSFVCQTIETIVETMYKLSTSYVADTSVVLDRLPSVVTHGASYYYIVLFLFLSTHPPKKKALIAILSGIFIAFFTLISGRRGEPISLILALVYYIIIRNRKGIRDIVISKRMVIIVAVALPFFVIFLQQLGSTRVGREFTSSSIEAIGNFFEDQGGSVRIIANGYDGRDRITEIGGRTYLLGEFRSYLKSNIFTQILFGTNAKSRLDRALSGDQYSVTYNYLFLSATSFANGIGGGTTYIAEAYHDGGYIMLALISVYIGVLLSILDIPRRFDSLIWTGIYINIMRYVAVLPRGYAFAWLTNTFSIQNIVLFLVCYLMLHRSKRS